MDAWTHGNVDAWSHGLHAAGAPPDDLVDSDKQNVSDLANFGIARLGRAWQLLLKGYSEVKQAPDSAASCEMLIIRLAHAAIMPTPGDILQKLHPDPNTPPPSKKSVKSASAELSAPRNNQNAAPSTVTSTVAQAKNNVSGCTQKAICRDLGTNSRRWLQKTSRKLF